MQLVDQVGLGFCLSTFCKKNKKKVISVSIQMRPRFCHLTCVSRTIPYCHISFVLTDNSQHTLIQVNSTLDARLVIASEESAGAQKVIAEKEEKYLKIRSEKESTLEEITKESQMLKNEAEGNSMVSFSE